MMQYNSYDAHRFTLPVNIIRDQNILLWGHSIFFSLIFVEIE